jgi:HSP20 family protein
LRSGEGQEVFASGEWAPLVDITETDQEYCVKAELPEIRKEDVKVSVENGVLKISGERKHEEETKNRKQHRIERSYGRFVRTFGLPDDVNPAKVTAESKDGILTIHVPKDVNAKTKAMDIKVA